MQNPRVHGVGSAGSLWGWGLVCSFRRGWQHCGLDVTLVPTEGAAEFDS